MAKTKGVYMNTELPIGAESQNGQVAIVDSDRLCYIVRNISRGAAGLRTISKQLLEEYVAYFRSNPNSNSAEARDRLCGKTELDKFEYGYTSTLTMLAQMVLEREGTSENSGNIACPKVSNKSLQQIFYGAPGTGKSHTIKEETWGEDVVRTTFHPDSDYSTFVGAYKPTTVEETVMTVIGTKAVAVENEDGSERKETKIVYEFVEQAFLKAYVQAWKNYAAAPADGEPRRQYLVVEEINRGNCAQIFGDLFQLLDRNADGFSEYPIQADKDMQKQLAKAFKGLSVPREAAINAQYDGKDIVRQVIDGEILLLPNNLYIWATMNTSDQSLFPIDSAFKRRWDWTYVPISNAGKNWRIEVAGVHYDWWQFLEKINHKIGETTSSEDKKLGYFFCKADGDGVISADKFVGKVIFYLWNDVFKDYEFSDGIFNDEEGGKLTFDKFYATDGRKSTVVESKVQQFLENLGLTPLGGSADDGSAEEQA